MSVRCAVMLLMVGPAWAQEQPPAAQGPGGADALPARTSLQDHSQGWQWTNTLADGRIFVDLAQDPQLPGLLLAVEVNGAVWRSEDAGQSWERSLDAPRPEQAGSDDEALLLEAEATAQDFFDSEVSEPEQEGELYESFEVDAADVDLLVKRSGLASGSPQARVGGMIWFHPERGGVVFVSRAGGLWRSGDGGSRWRQVSTLSTATDMLLLTDGSMIAGTDDGVLISRDMGHSWRATRGTQGMRVRDLTRSGTLVFAATDQGLLLSGDGERWAPSSSIGAVKADLRAVLADPRMDGGLWVATDQEVLRSDDAGQSLFPLSGTPLAGTSNLSIDEKGALLVATSDGVWESLDGGVRWHPLSRGMPGPICKDVLLTPHGAVAATAYGLWLLTPAQDTGSRQPTHPDQLQGLSLNQTLGLALSRPGMDSGTLGMRAGNTFARRATPELILKGNLQDYDSRYSNYGTLQTEGDTNLRWYVGAELRWNSNGSSESSLDGADLDPERYYVLNGAVLSSQDGAGIPVAAANVDARGVRYQRSVSAQVTDLYLSRHQLILARDGLPPDDLRARAQHELKIQESTALLDAYTGGAFSAAQVSSDAEGETL